MSLSEDRFVYCDCFSGISGDMFLGALVDMGLSVDTVSKDLETLLPTESFEIRAVREKRGSIWGTRILINCDSKEESKKFRNFGHIKNLIETSDLPGAVKTKSIEVFRVIGLAEGKIHNTDLEDVHFHEVGALDSIIDIVGTISGLYRLGVRRVISSPLPMGRGFIKTQHGLIPNPGPATLEILKGVALYGVESARELVTPTGAALVKVLADTIGTLPSCTIENIGYGVGSRVEDHPPNLLRLILGCKEEDRREEDLVLFQTNIDDMPQEFYEYVMEKLFEKGALDVWFTPIVMKKSRPAVEVSVLAMESLKDAVESILFLETTTGGVRSFKISRRFIPRREEMVETPWGSLKVKVFMEPGGKTRIAPEYEECKEKARQYSVPLKEIYNYCMSLKLEDLSG